MHHYSGQLNIKQASRDVKDWFTTSIAIVASI